MRLTDNELRGERVYSREAWLDQIMNMLIDLDEAVYPQKTAMLKRLSSRAIFQRKLLFKAADILMFRKKNETEVI